MLCAVRVIAAALLCAGAGAALADDSIASSGASLRARHLALHVQLGDNPFHRPSTVFCFAPVTPLVTRHALVLICRIRISHQSPGTLSAALADSNGKLTRA